MVSIDSIPGWNIDGVIPPSNVDNPVSRDRSPYSVSLIDCILRFGTTESRLIILERFMGFRTALHSVGLVNGFQWIDGSFLENIEETEGRDPNDIDLVTFYHLPDGVTDKDLVSRSPHLFDPRMTKRNYCIDAYFVRLDDEDPETMIKEATYWYSIWSHRRDGLWKGFLQIDLSNSDDQVAAINLKEIVDRRGAL